MLRCSEEMRKCLLPLFILLIVFCHGCKKHKGQEVKAEKERIWLSILGGAAGGSFSPFAGAIANVLSSAEPNVKISVEASAGSIENVRRVNGTEGCLGVAFASDVYLGYHGREIFAKEGRRGNIRVVSLLYVAYNQFSTLADSNIDQLHDIVGKKIAMGAAGSGSAQTLERLATLAGIQGKYTPVYKGGTAAGNALRDGQVVGFQWLVSVPNAAIIEVSTIKPIRLIDLDVPAKKYGFYAEYPFYLSGTIPAGAYKGIDQPVNTILMPTLLIAHKDIAPDIIQALLRHVYSQKGHTRLLNTTRAARDMKVENAHKAFVIPLHTGAYQFWEAQGVDIPESVKPVD